MRRDWLSGCLLVLVLAMLSPLVAAEGSRGADRTQIGRDLVVQAGEKAGDVVCVGCSITLRGEASGDVVAVAGGVTIEPGAQVAGGVTTVFGDLRLRSDTRIGGDAVAVAGSIRRDPTSTVGGEITALEGAGWMALLLLAPLVFFGGIIALIVWLIQRSRRPTPVAA